MMPFPAGHARHVPDLIAASLLTAGDRGEVHFVARDGRKLTLVTDPETARQVAVSVWTALARPQ